MRHRLEYALVRGAQMLVGLLPMSAVRGLGGALGRIVYALDGFHRRVAIENLSHAFPTRPRGELHALTRAMFMHFGRWALELLKFSGLTREQMMQLVESEGEERVWQAYEQGRGVLLFTGHFGYWETQALVLALRIRPLSVLARPLDNPHVHALLERVRTCTGNTVIYRKGAVRKVLRELTENRGVAILIDQHLLTPDAVYVDFFSRPAATTSALAALALRTGAPVIPAFALPLPHGRYRLVYERPVEPPHSDSPDAVREFTQRCTDVLEMYVRRRPDLWLWMHRRWRDVPPQTGDSTLSFDKTDADV